MNRLFTKELEQSFENFKLYSQDDKGPDAICVAVFSIGNAKWYILEGERDGDDFLMFGIVIGLIEDEYGYISLNELASVKIDVPECGISVQVLHLDGWKPCPLSKIADERLSKFLKRIHDNQ